MADSGRKVADVGSKKYSLVVSGNVSGTVLEPSFNRTNDFSRWRQQLMEYRNEMGCDSELEI